MSNYEIDKIVDSLVEVVLTEEQNFLKIKETLTRIGVASNHTKKLFQSCHILHKRGKYYICHFKELFLLDGKSADISEQDLARRNSITVALQSWGLLKIVKPEVVQEPFMPLKRIKVIPYKEKNEWELISKYTIGNTGVKK